MPELESDLSPENLPRAHVLSYITTVSTPTRVRVVAARVVLIVSLLNAVLALWLVGAGGSNIWRLAVARTAAPPVVMWGPGGPVVVPAAPLRSVMVADVVAASREVMRRDPDLVFMLVLVMGSTIGLLVAAPAIRRGRRMPSLLVLVYFALGAVAVGLIEVLLIGAGFTVQYMRHPQFRDWWAVWWLLLIPVGAMPVVLMKDVCAFLLWIARHPIAEKPAVPFLPGGERTDATS